MENLDLRHHPDLEIMEPLTQVVEEEDLEAAAGGNGGSGIVMVAYPS